MGKILNSLKSQVGRDAGKVISNMVWGDKHAAPYRRVENESRRKKNKLNESRIELENQHVELRQRQVDIEVSKEELKVQQIKQQEFDVRINKIISKIVPDEKNSLMTLLNELALLLNANPWKESDQEDGATANGYADALLSKYEQTLFALQRKSPTDAIYFERQLKILKKRRFRNKYNTTIFAVIAFCVLMGICAVMSFLED